MMITASNTVTLLKEAAIRFPNRRALIATDKDGRVEVLTFSALWDRVCRISNGLVHQGLAVGSRAVIMLPMSIDLYVVLAAILKAGAEAVFFDPWASWKQIARFSSVIRPDAFLGVSKSHLLRLLEPGLRNIKLSVTNGLKMGNLPAALTLRQLEHFSADEVIVPRAAQDTAMITFTSGSSGEPKGTDRTHGLLSAQHRVLGSLFPAEEDDVEMTTLPIFVLHNLASGISSVIPIINFSRVADADPQTILSQIRLHGVTRCTVSPALLDRLSNFLHAHPEQQSSIRSILCGGAPINDTQLANWRKAWPDSRITVLYGSTEAEPVSYISLEERLDIGREGNQPFAGYCVGRPVELIATKIVRIHKGPIRLKDGDWTGWEQPAGVVGELVVSGDHVCKSYYQNQDATRENKIIDGSGTVWHRMGDTGYLDSEGRVWLQGRVHTTIMRAGTEYHAQQIEQIVESLLPNRQRGAVLGVADELLGERLTVVLEREVAENIKIQMLDLLRNRSIPVDDILAMNKSMPVDPRHNSKIDYEMVRRHIRTKLVANKTESLSSETPYLVRLSAYLKERFPLLGNVLLIISYYSANQFLAKSLVHPDTPMTYSYKSLFGALTLLCLFFHLRVFDEHKDYVEDCKYYPNRVLQRGIITLNELKRLGALAIALEILASIIAGIRALVSTMIALGFSVLMLKEFFVKVWLRRHFLVYVVTHMLIMPLFSMVIFSFSTDKFPWQAPPLYWLYAFVGFFVTLNWEISRKIRSPEEEIEGVISYTKVWGTYGAAYMVLIVRAIDTFMVWVVGFYLNLSLLFYITLGLLYCVCVAGFLQYRFCTNAKTAKRLEFYAGMYIIAFDLILALELIRKHGFQLKAFW